MTYAASIETSILGTDNAKAILLSVNVLLKNVGNADASVTNDEQAIRVARVHFADNTIAALIDPVYSGFYLVSEPHKERGMLKIGSVALLANQTKELTGLVSIAHDGLYTANFVGTASENPRLGGTVDSQRQTL